MLAETVQGWSEEMKKEGEAIAVATMLLLVFEEKFGQISTTDQIKVIYADRRTLAKWYYRFLEADTLDDVFGE